MGSHAISCIMIDPAAPEGCPGGRFKILLIMTIPDKLNILIFARGTNHVNIKGEESSLLFKKYRWLN